MNNTKVSFDGIDLRMAKELVHELEKAVLNLPEKESVEDCFEIVFDSIREQIVVYNWVDEEVGFVNY